MKNFIAEGDILDVEAPYGVVSGEGVKVGQLFGVAVADADTGDGVRIKTTGIFEMAKTSAQAWTVGQQLYWDDSLKVVTSTDNDVPIGAAAAVAANPSATGLVRLTGSIVGTLVTS